jgi:MFS family permease
MLLVLAWGQVTSLLQLYAIWALIGVCMAMTLYDPAFATASRWFERHRIRALTVITLMAGFASTIFIPLAGWLVQVQGWRASLVTLALILGVGTIAPHALLLRRRPEDRGQGPDGAPLTPAARETHGHGAEQSMPVGQALREPSFRWLTVAFWLAALATIAVSVHLLPYLLDRGYDATAAATLVGLVGAMQVAARLLMAPFGSRTSPRFLAATMFALQPIALVVLLLWRSTAGVLLFIVLFGAQRGLSTIARPALLADLYGRAHFASIAGALQLTIALSQAVAPAGAGAAYDLWQSYEPVFWGLAVISALAVLAVLPARRDPARRLQSVS